MQNLFSQDFAKDRSESDILAHEPIKLMLGKKEFPAPPLTLRKGAKWRQQVADILNDLVKGAMAANLTADTFMQGILVAFFAFPDKVLELLIAYAPELEKDRDWLMDNATDEEVVVALSRVLVVAYPYFSLLGTMKTAAMATSPATSQR